MKIDSNRNINKAEVYHQKCTQYGLPATPPEAHAAPEMHSWRNSDKLIKDATTITCTQPKEYLLKNTMTKTN